MKQTSTILPAIALGLLSPLAIAGPATGALHFYRHNVAREKKQPPLAGWLSIKTTTIIAIL